MEPMYEAFYTHSMMRNAEAAMRCHARTQRLLAMMADEEKRRQLDPRLILDEIQSLVTYAGALARYFWPARKEYSERGAYLRQKLGIADDNPLANKELRNGLEHFDERLDEYLKNEVFGMILPDYVGNSFKQGQGPKGHLFRAFFVDTQCFVLFNEPFHLPPLLEALYKIAQALHDKDLSGMVVRVKPKD